MHVVKVFHRQPAIVPRDDPYVQALGAAIARVAEPTSERLGVGRDGASDAISFLEAGVPAVECGPSGDGHHGPEEWVSIRSLGQYRAALVEFVDLLRPPRRARLEDRLMFQDIPRPGLWKRLLLGAFLVVFAAAGATAVAAFHEVDKVVSALELGTELKLGKNTLAHDRPRQAADDPDPRLGPAAEAERRGSERGALGHDHARPARTRTRRPRRSCRCRAT